MKRFKVSMVNIFRQVWSANITRNLVSDSAIERFCFVGTTGRTGTHFLNTLFSSEFCMNTASFHDDLFGRIGNVGGFQRNKCPKNHRLPRTFKGFLGSLFPWNGLDPRVEESLDRYFQTLLELKPGRSIYVECNGGFAEYIALSYNISNAHSVLKLLEMREFSVRCLYIVRNPIDYVKSLKAVDWKWDWPGLPFFEEVYQCSRSEWEDLSHYEKKCFGWVLKNKFFHTLTESENCMMVRFEDLFGPGVTGASFVDKVEEICSFLGVPLIAPVSVLAKQRKVKIAVKNPDPQPLSSDELAILNRICSREMELLGYTSP